MKGKERKICAQEIKLGVDIKMVINYANLHE